MTGMAQDKVARRHLFGYAGAGGVGAVAGALAGRLSVPEPPGPEVIRQSYSPHGTHQAGIVTPVPAAHRLVAFTLKPGTDRAALGRLMRVWSTDIALLMSGQGILGDTAPELAQANVSLTVTVGLGPKVFTLEGMAGQAPDGFVDIPPMKHDRLQERWSGGDLLLLIAADDTTSVEHASSRLIRDAGPFASVRWVQHAFWRTLDASGNPVTGRNLFGQVDGTANPAGADRDATLWPANPPAWFAGGTTLVVRRIEFEMATWDKLVRDRQELVIGRNLTNGAPLTGTNETDEMDFDAHQDGRLIIPADAHARRSHPRFNDGRRIFRRGLNYTHEEYADGAVRLSAGLVFMSFQADISKQFIPIQKNLDASDALNEWTHAIGSAVFAIPGGFAEDSWLAKELLA